MVDFIAIQTHTNSQQKKEKKKRKRKRERYKQIHYCFTIWWGHLSLSSLLGELPINQKTSLLGELPINQIASLSGELPNPINHFLSNET